MASSVSVALSRRRATVSTIRWISALFSRVRSTRTVLFTCEARASAMRRSNSPRLGRAVRLGSTTPRIASRMLASRERPEMTKTALMMDAAIGRTTSAPTMAEP